MLKIIFYVLGVAFMAAAVLLATRIQEFRGCKHWEVDFNNQKVCVEYE